jgi:hypothetical protein
MINRSESVSAIPGRIIAESDRASTARFLQAAADVTFLSGGRYLLKAVGRAVGSTCR